MTEYLVFRLAAPLASFGAVAVGERRPSWDRPSKSQIIGLVAATLGIERSQEGRLSELAAGLGFAVRVDDPGRPAVDYHTAQSPKEASLRRRAKEVGPVRTRADELACDDLKTILSRREFRTEGLYTVALWKIGEVRIALANIGRALASPAFIPYAGRKAHALMLPMCPQFVEATQIEQVFDAYDQRLPKSITELAASLGLRPSTHRPIYCDLAAVPQAEMHERVSRLEERRDIPESRAKWRFGLRPEALLRGGSRPGGAQ
jgi:CRISPR system Cascade subunit CasD